MKISEKQIDTKENNYPFAMYAEYEDGYSCYIYGMEKEDCMFEVCNLPKEHGECLYYTCVNNKYRIDGELKKEKEKNNRTMIRYCKAGNLIKIMDAKAKVIFWDNETEKLIFSGYVYQLYDNKEMTEKLYNLYIYDLTIDYDGIRVLTYDKWK